MPRLIMIALLLGSLALLPACGGDGSEGGEAETPGTQNNDGNVTASDTSPTSPREQIVEDLLVKMDEFPQILSGVSDNASAEAASAQLTELAASIKPLVDKWVGLGEMTDGEASSIASKYKEQIVGFEEKMAEQMTRIAGENPLLLSKLQDGMNAIQEAMSGFDIDG